MKRAMRAAAFTTSQATALAGALAAHQVAKSLPTPQ